MWKGSGEAATAALREIRLSLRSVKREAGRLRSPFVSNSTIGREICLQIAERFD
jgi:hypothetical protein